MGPQVKDGAIVYDTLTASSQLPSGYTDTQPPGHYQLSQSEHQRYFAWANGPQAIKPLTFASQEKLWRCQRDANGEIRFTSNEPEIEPLAVIGARACDIALCIFRISISSTRKIKIPFIWHDANDCSWSR